MLSQTAVYALRASLTLADMHDSGPVTVDDISSRLGVPRNYLSKILHTLARGGVLTSTRGPGGGFRLARPAADLTLSEIVRHFDEVPEDAGCLLGREKCSDADPCPAHERWKDVAVAVHKFFNETTLADVSHSDLAHSEAPADFPP
jgi:Rrf2 family protein